MIFRKFIFIIFFSNSILDADVDFTINNTNLIHSIDDTTYNYNRLRVQANYNKNNFFLTFIGDGVNYLGDDYINSKYFYFLKQIRSNTPFKTQTSFSNYNNGSSYAKLYRLYGGYEDEKNRIIIGLQNISMGVGRIWTPTNIFNPQNIYALEPDEVFGVSAINYTHHIDDMSQISLVISQQHDKSLKYATQYKTFLNFADIAINLIKSDKTKMVGYEIEGNLGDSGIEIRSEGSYIKENKTFFQAIFGADYGFENGINIMGELLYNSKTFSSQETTLNFDSEILSNIPYSHFSFGTTLSYNFNLFLDASLLYIENFSDKNSRFIAPTITYTFNDYNSFVLGVINSKGNEFSVSQDSYYLIYKLSF